MTIILKSSFFYPLLQWHLSTIDCKYQIKFLGIFSLCWDQYITWRVPLIGHWKLFLIHVTFWLFSPWIFQLDIGSFHFLDVYREIWSCFINLNFQTKKIKNIKRERCETMNHMHINLTLYKPNTRKSKFTKAD